jgi:hypothetical protein
VRRSARLDADAAQRVSAQAELETADLDARVLAAKLAGVEPHQLVTGGDAPLGEKVRDRLAKSRAAGRPARRHAGAPDPGFPREFYGLSLEVFRPRRWSRVPTRKR